MYRPEFGGKYCTGERKRYRICNTKPCARKQPSFREMQCSEFNTVPYHNELYEWIPVAVTCKITCIKIFLSNVCMHGTRYTTGQKFGVIYLTKNA